MKDIEKEKAMRLKFLFTAVFVSSLVCSAAKPAPEVTLSVMSYNIRLGTANDGTNSWMYRYPATLMMLEDVQPDVVGLQEAMDFQILMITENHEQYEAVGVGRDDGKKEGEQTAIVYNKKKIALQKWGTFWLSDTPDSPSKGWDAACKRTATWALMKCKKTGRKFYFVNTHLDHVGEEAREVEGESCHGINVKVTGINAYYIFNHKRFSYPAAFAQSTVQRKSCGSWKAGFSYTRHELNFDYGALPPALTQDPEHGLSQDFRINKLKYDDYSISCGYAYNWVFKPGWLLCVSLAPAIGYKQTRSNVEPVEKEETDEPFWSSIFNLDNFNVDVTGRVGLVWNNTKYFGGLSLIVHNYNYRHNRLSINNTFGTLNFYVGLNFHKRKAYR